MKSIDEYLNSIIEMHTENEALEERYKLVGSYLKQIKGYISNKNGHGINYDNALKIEINEDSNNYVVTILTHTYLFSYSPFIENGTVKGQINFTESLPDGESKTINTIKFNRSEIESNTDRIFIDDSPEMIKLLLSMLINALDSASESADMNAMDLMFKG